MSDKLNVEGKCFRLSESGDESNYGKFFEDFLIYLNGRGHTVNSFVFLTSASEVIVEDSSAFRHINRGKIVRFLIRCGCSESDKATFHKGIAYKVNNFGDRYLSLDFGSDD